MEQELALWDTEGSRLLHGSFQRFSRESAILNLEKTKFLQMKLLTLKISTSFWFLMEYLSLLKTRQKQLPVQ